MSLKFWLTASPGEIKTASTEWTDVRLNSPQRFRQDVIRERRRIQRSAIALRRFERFLRSLPKSAEEQERRERRLANTERLQSFLRNCKHTISTQTETIREEGRAPKTRTFRKRLYLEPAIQGFYEHALRLTSFNSEEFDPGNAWMAFFKGYLKRLGKVEPPKRDRVGRPAKYEIDRGTVRIVRDLWMRELGRRGGGEDTVHVAKNWWEKAIKKQYTHIEWKEVIAAYEGDEWRFVSAFRNKVYRSDREPAAS